jgi:hypothetical protein
VDGASAEAKWKLDRQARRAWLGGRRQYLATKAARATDAATPPESPRGSIGVLEAAFPPELRVRPGETSGVRITTLTHVCLTEDRCVSVQHTGDEQHCVFFFATCWIFGC